jgi:hypothetical protein
MPVRHTLLTLIIPAVLLALSGMPATPAPAAETSATGEVQAGGRDAGQQGTGQETRTEAPKRTPAASLAMPLIRAYLGTTLASARAANKDLTIGGLIATLPDPSVSRFAITFDDQFGGLQRGLEAAGYVLDRFDIQWEPVAADSTAKPNTDAHRRPGVLLFRRPPDELLVVWIVGETPTTGISKTAFARAIADHSTVVGNPPADAELIPCDEEVPTDIVGANTAPVRILGPTFSGSVPSLDRAIRAWKACVGNVNPAPDITIISGSATAVPLAGKAFAIGDAPFHATVASDDSALTALLDYLREIHHVGIDEVALLTEANTDYGRAAGQKQGPRRVPFPLHIAQLRKKSKDDVSGLSAPGIARESALSSIVLDSNRQTIDVPQPQAVQAPASADVMLADALETIADAHIRYVGILASDVRDTIVLSRELRKHVPNATIFTLNHELLYLHPEVNPSMIGTLVVSSYPLVTSNRQLTYPFSTRYGPSTFPTDRAIGTYNAAVALLGRKNLLIEYADPALPASQYPPHWLTIIGQGTFWPLQTLPASGNIDGYLFDARSVKDLIHGPGHPKHAVASVPSTFYPFFIGWCLACAFMLYTMGGTLGRRQGRSFDGTVGRLRLLTGRPSFSRYLHILSAIFVMAIVHGLASIVLLLPFDAHYRDGGRPFDFETMSWATMGGFGLSLTGTVAIAIALPWAGLITLRGLKRESSKLPTWRIVAFVIVILSGVGGLALAGNVAMNWLKLDAMGELLLGLRAADLDGGVSPLLPLFCIAAAALCSTSASLRRLSIADEAMPQLATPAPPSSFDALDEGEQRLNQTFAVEAAELAGFPAIFQPIALVAFGLFFTGFAPPPEVHQFQLFFGVAFIVVYLSLTTEAVRFAYGWWALRGHLRRLAWHPIGLNYDTAKKGAPALNLTHTSHPMAGMRYLAERAQAFLVKAAPKASPAPALALPHGLTISELQGLLDTAERSLVVASAEDARFRLGASTTARGAVAAALNDFCTRVAQAFDAAWLAPTASTHHLLADAADLMKARALAVLHLHVKQLQSLIAFVTVGLLLMLLAVSIYPLQPHGWLLTFNWFVMSTTIVMAMVVFAQMDRDAVMSAVTGTAAGKMNVDRDFWLKLFLYVAVPLLSLLGANFPEFFREVIKRLGGPAG